MATIRQKRLAKLIVKNTNEENLEGVTKMLEKVGYAPSTANHKQKEIFEGNGLKEELESLGFSEFKAKTVVGEILMTGEEQNRLKAADMIFKVHSTYAPEKHQNLNVNVHSELDSLIAQSTAEKLKELKT